MKVKVINKSNNPLPEYSTPQSAGMDLRAFIEEPLTLRTLDRVIIHTGLYIEMPEGYEAQVRPRSGLALKHGITILNSPGTIDADFRGEICVILVNLSNIPFTIASGTRIAQLVFSKYEQAELVEVEELNNTERGEGGFGHTGNK